VTQLERSTGDACGKVILFGEHAVVHGAPAIAAGIERAVHASAALSTRASSILRIGHRDILAHVSASDDLGRAFHALLKVAPALPPLHVEARSELPSGGGLGSSAALAVAVARAAQAFAETNDRDPDVMALERAAAWEKIFHGNPSGVDATAASRGGIFRYSRADGAKTLYPPRDIVLCVGWSGTPSSTREMVGLIAARLAKDPHIVNSSIAAIHSIVDAAASAIVAGDHTAIGKLMDMNQLVLSGLMVSTSEIEELCALAREQVALGAKLTGGGGGGSVIALVPPSLAANGESDRDIEAETAARIIDAWRQANRRYNGFVTRIHADKRGASTTVVAIEGAAL
jgi:mevalonate kinase